MTQDRAAPPESDFETIEPVRVDVGSAAESAPADSNLARFAPWIVIALLLLVLVAVVTVLPRVVTVPEAAPPGTPAPAAAGSARPAPATPATPALSPWEQAQQEQARERARAVLDEVLAAQLELRDSGVELWAPEAFEAALDSARAGDAQYRQQAFDAALEDYRLAAQRMQDLLDSRDGEFRAQLERARAAIADGDRASAESALEIALLIRPDDAEAQTAAERAAVIDEVQDLLRTGRRQQETGDYAAARDAFARAVELDGASRAARQGLESATTLLEEQQFTEAMSEGFGQLADERFAAAERAFRRAAALRPDSEEVREALRQVEAGSTLQKVQVELRSAEQAAAGEDWPEAVAAYRRALEVDGTLERARAALQQAETRLRLDEVIRQTLDDPLSLNDDARYRDMVALLRGARQIDAPGPRLDRQLRELEQVLRLARTPVRLTVESDGETEVSVLRVERLGTLESTELDLNPGRYVLVGRRQGYRDVREEIVLAQGTRTARVTVQCTEPI
jgi:tetratricopeptide (TPR) repeat protein